MRRSPRLVRTPVGTLCATARTDGSVAVGWRGDAAPAGPVAAIDPEATALLAHRLRKWIRGDMRALQHAALPPGTPWQRACWSSARRIPAGQTRSYLWLAQQACRALGRAATQAPALARAAGQAMRRNPAPIVVPCHRVVGMGGIGGYAGSDDPRSVHLARKRWLLALESRAKASP